LYLILQENTVFLHVHKKTMKFFISLPTHVLYVMEAILITAHLYSCYSPFPETHTQKEFFSHFWMYAY